MNYSTRKHIMDCLNAVWESLSTLCESFSQNQWELPTDCPGWSVQDQLSHLTGSEPILDGGLVPEHTPPRSSHVKNQIGIANEIQVDYRRSCSGSEVIAEFNVVTHKRRQTLASMTDDDIKGETESPSRTGLSEALYIRIFDAWIHEQDIRRAVGMPGHFDGPVAKYSLRRMADVMPYVVGKRAEAPDGSMIWFRITGPVCISIPIGVSDGRASRLGSKPNSPMVTLTMDLETFMRLCCGRVAPHEVLDKKCLKIEGNVKLGKKIVRQMAYIP